MTWLNLILVGLVLTAGGVAVVARRRYLALQRKHQILQRLYDRAEQQLSTLWAGKKP